jgi:hypothetical protein
MRYSSLPISKLRRSIFNTYLWPCRGANRAAAETGAARKRKSAIMTNCLRRTVAATVFAVSGLAVSTSAFAAARIHHHRSSVQQQAPVAYQPGEPSSEHAVQPRETFGEQLRYDRTEEPFQ